MMSLIQLWEINFVGKVIKIMKKCESFRLFVFFSTEDSSRQWYVILSYLFKLTLLRSLKVSKV
jgi:hypothetical protein